MSKCAGSSRPESARVKGIAEKFFFRRWRGRAAFALLYDNSLNRKALSVAFPYGVWWRPGRVDGATPNGIAAARLCRTVGDVFFPGRWGQF